MKKFLTTLLIVIAFVTFTSSAFAVNHFDDPVDPYRVESETGHLYLTDAQSTIFVCDGRYITSQGNTSTPCLLDSEIMSRRAKTRTARFFTRVAAVGAYFAK